MEIVVRQSGGLGNQLFQYALGRYYATRYNADLQIATESQKNPHCLGDPRPFLLSQFRVAAPYRELNSIDKLLISPSPRIRPLLKALDKYLGIQVFREPYAEHHIGKTQLPIRANARCVYLSGLWQFHNHLAAVSEQLRDEIQVREPPRDKNLEVFNRIQQASSPVAIHVRSSDLVHCYGEASILSEDYYRKAIRIISNRVTAPTFFVFSEDMFFARKNLPNNVPLYFVDHNDSASVHEDLRLMMTCRHNIIANSSLSWWGAWLNPNPTKTVVAPERWLGQQISHIDLIPEGWTQIGDQSLVS